VTEDGSPDKSELVSRIIWTLLKAGVLAPDELDVRKELLDYDIPTLLAILMKAHIVREERGSIPNIFNLSFGRIDENNQENQS